QELRLAWIGGRGPPPHARKIWLAGGGPRRRTRWGMMPLCLRFYGRPVFAERAELCRVLQTNVERRRLAGINHDALLRIRLQAADVHRNVVGPRLRIDRVFAGCRRLCAQRVAGRRVLRDYSRIADALA